MSDEWGGGSGTERDLRIAVMVRSRHSTAVRQTVVRLSVTVDVEMYSGPDGRPKAMLHGVR